MSWPSNSIAPVRGIMPEMARIVVVLPAPLAPRITTTSPSCTVEVDPVQHLDRAVAGATRPLTSSSVAHASVPR